MGGRARRLAALFPDYLGNAWAGLVAPRFAASGPARVVQGVVQQGDRVLLAVRRELRGWELPGGSALPGESETQALQREVLEETGLRVEATRLVGEYQRSGFRPHVARVYACRVMGGTLTASPEMPAVRWWPAHAPPDTLFPWYRGPLRDALAPAAAPVLRHERQGLAAVLAGMRIDLRMRLRGE